MHIADFIACHSIHIYVITFSIGVVTVYDVCVNVRQHGSVIKHAPDFGSYSAGIQNLLPGHSLRIIL